MTAPLDDVGLIYLEADDEVTSVVRRVRASPQPRVVVVAPGRSRATSSAVALRLLARAAEAEARQLAVVGDALTRSLAVEVGVAAYASVDDARAATVPDATAPSVATQAAIHVVREGEVDDTAPTLAAAPPTDRGAETRMVATSQPRTRRPERRGLDRRLPAAAALALVALLVVAAGVAGAMLLPTATVSLTPRTLALPQRTYTFDVDDAERRTGTAEAVEVVTATGTYPIVEYATGVVTFRNWSGSPVRLEAGTLVAAGVQAFQTIEPVDVPAGRLLPNGTIGAGQVDAPVVAMAPGPEANVGAMEVDVVLTEPQASRLRAFADNPQPIVLNAAPMTGGSATTGTEITQADVDTAVTALREELADDVDARLDEAGMLLVPVGVPPEPTIAGDAELVGMRDLATADISGSLAYDAWLVDPQSVERDALIWIADDDGAVPDGHRLVTETIEVSIVASEATADDVRVTVAVRAEAVRVVDEEAVVQRVRGLTAEEAESELADLGRASVTLWPDWATEVPELEWRIEVTIEGAAGGRVPSSPEASASP